jgi:hypothetical protein
LALAVQVVFLQMEVQALTLRLVPLLLLVVDLVPLITTLAEMAVLAVVELALPQ